MPELPEVEICRRQLEHWAVGRRILAIDALDAAVFRTHLSTSPRDADPQPPVAELVGQAVVAVHRHGKRLAIRFERIGLLCHLGMTGRWLRNPDPTPRTARLRLALSDAELVFADRRRFGCVAACPLDRLDGQLRAGHGPDAYLEPLDGAGILGALRGRRALKVALMDQTVVAGLGNIHAGEALWRAGIHPAVPCSSLTADRADRLARAILEQIALTLEAAGPGPIVYVSDGGENPFAVYGRAGEPCPACATPIARAVLGGRSAYWCPHCQQ